jgi:hypothetical protein
MAPRKKLLRASPKPTGRPVKKNSTGKPKTKRKKVDLKDFLKKFSPPRKNPFERPKISPKPPKFGPPKILPKPPRKRNK